MKYHAMITSGKLKKIETAEMCCVDLSLRKSCFIKMLYVYKRGVN